MGVTPGETLVWAGRAWVMVSEKFSSGNPDEYMGELFGSKTKGTQELCD